MADFVAVLKKTLDGLDDPTPEMRERVYAKARTTIAAKLAALNPPPAAAVIDRQTEALEKAIAEIEADLTQNGGGANGDDDPLAEFVSGAAFGTPAAPTPVAPVPAVPPPAPSVQMPEPTAVAGEPEIAPSPAPSPEPAAADVPGNGAKPEPAAGSGPDVAAIAAAAPTRKRGYGGLIAALIIVALLAGAGYAIWQNKEDFARMAGLENMFSGTDAADGAATGDDAGNKMTAGDDAGQPAAADDTSNGGDKAAADTEEPKFTQRLLADGTEVDPGPAGDEPTIGEGTSVAAATADDAVDTVMPAPDEQTGGEDAAATDENAAAGDENAGAGEENAGEKTGAEAPADTALPVGQRAIFYEERTSNLQGSAEPGAVVWSLVQEAPGENLPEEAAIRAEATIPGKDLQFRMTIRRNADKSLPASHIIEMIFITPDDFEGGSIDNVLRITFKDSEQSAGNPLLGIPAKISDGFFLLALTDSKADIEANNTMMRRLDWLDIPIVYSTGRRALITMEKGVPGSKVFDEALKAWATETSG
ncbi:MAG: hypothetical protein R3D45_13855 [Rhizobiaceae bacterium]